MLTATAFRNAVQMTAARMRDGEIQAVRSAIKAGSKAIDCCRYYEGGPLVLTVTKPAHWRTEIWERVTRVSCVVPAGREAETLAWATRNPA